MAAVKIGRRHGEGTLDPEGRGGHACDAGSDLTSCCIRSSIPRPSAMSSPRACRLRPVPPSARSCSRPMRPRPGSKRARRSSWSAKETSPEDIGGMDAAEGILTAFGRYDQPRGGGGPRYGQVLRRRRARFEYRLQNQEALSVRQGHGSRKVISLDRHRRHGRSA